MRVATFNIRNTTDRYDERLPLIQAAVATMAASVIGLQEVSFDDAHDGVGSQASVVARAWCVSSRVVAGVVAGC